MQISETVSFQPYSSQEPDRAPLFLHADSHATLDYTAMEDPQDDTQQQLAHYIGVYDPGRQRLKLVPARKMTIHSTLKASRPSSTVDAKADDVDETKPKISARSALGLEFGSKKTQKNIRERINNAMTTSKPIYEDPIASAVLSSLPVDNTDKEALQTAMDLARPTPRPNMKAAMPTEVYTIEELVGEDSLLGRMKVKEWKDAVEAGQTIQTRSRFVSNRLAFLSRREDVKLLRVLRYTLMLYLWYKSLRTTKKHDGGKLLPKLELQPGHGSMQSEYATDLARQFGKDLVQKLNQRFGDREGKVTRWHDDRVITHILALTLVLDSFETDTYDIQLDLQLDAQQIAKYYQQLGCSVKAMSKREYERKGLGRVEALQRKIATLALPLKFPKEPGGARRKRR